MLEAIKQLARKVSKIDEKAILMTVLKDSTLQAQMIDLNQEQLYDKGIQSDGSPTGEYSPKTVAIKLSEGDSWNTPGRTDHITGNDTGITYRSMKVKAAQDGVVITADDRNGIFDGTNSVPARLPFGLGLTDESLQELQPLITELYIEEIYKKIA